MKKLEYILNAIYYGMYLFFKKTSFSVEGRTDHYFISNGLGGGFLGSITINLFSVVIVINKALKIPNIMPFWIVICLMMITYGIQYYFIERSKKYLMYVKKFMRERKPWKYILIGLLYWIGSIVFFCLSLAIKF